MITSKKRNYYVYGYVRLDTNTYFYIGKGKNNRYLNIDNRKQHFKNIINKVDCAVEILYDNLTEDEAFQLEVDTIYDLVFNEGYSIEIKGIKKNKGQHLVNKTWGGEGSSGYKFSEKQLKKTSEAHKGKGIKSVYIIELDKTFNSICECARFLGCRQQCVSSALISKSKLCRDYHIIWNKDKDNKELIDKVMSYKEKNSPIYVIELDKVFDNAKDCAEFLGCESGSVNNVLNENRKYKMIKGYHIIYAKDKDNKGLIEEIMQYESNKKSVYIIELDKEFESVSECARFLGCNKNNVSAMLNGRSKICRGYHVIYAEDKDNKELINEVMQYKCNRGKKKQVYVIELDMYFDSMTECARYLRCDVGNVSSVLNGKSKTCKKYHIIYAKDRDKLAS